MADSKTYSVAKYLAAVKRLVSEQIPTIWVHGVIAQIQERGRMVYLTLTEYAQGDVKPVAVLPLFIFASDNVEIQRKLAVLPSPFQLQVELKVNLLIQADFYVPHGKFQGRVLDVDPVYTLGEMALTRQAILERLVRENLKDRNGRLPMADAPLRVGLVTGEGTAAFQDFTTVLANSGFAFEIIPAWARMQGSEMENTVLSALGNLLRVPGLDVVCIVRGGGSRTDLNYFDSEALCRAVALYPVPVLTGIGHEIDQSLLDLVAWEARITPTDCAKFLVNRAADSWACTLDLGRRIAQRTGEALKHALLKLEGASIRLNRALPQRLSREQERHARMLREVFRSAQRRCTQEHSLLERNQEGLAQGARKILQYQNLTQDLLAERIRSHDPRRLLARGYTLSLDEQGKVVRSVEQLRPGTVLETRFADGTVRSLVSDIHLPAS